MDALTDLADRYFAFAMGESPTTLMWNGRLQHLAEWDDFSPERQEELRIRNLAFADEADALDVGDGERAVALRDSIATGARASAIGVTWDVELLHLNPKMGMFELCLSFIGEFPLVTKEHGEQYIEKLRGMPAALASLAKEANDAAAQGRVALARHLLATADSVDAYLAAPAGAEDRLGSQAAPTELSDAEAAAWRKARDRVVADVTRPGVAAFGAALRDLAAKGQSDDKPGLCHLPGGLEVYRDKMWSNLLTDHTPEQVHQVGLDTIATLEEEYRAIGGPLLGTTDIGEIYARLRDDASLKYTEADAVVKDSEAALARANALAPAFFAHLPQSSCPAHATDFGPMAYYSAPDLATGKQGARYFNTSDPGAWSTYELESVTFHESIPGHHLQLALQAENEDLHPVQQEFFNTAYAEGWGLYAERLADEMGLYSSELARLGMLSADSLRACRLVVDTGMHALGWSRGQAIQYMLDHTPMDIGHIEAEIDRYIGLPGQALAYMMGRIEIQSIRAEAEARPGFDLREFHDAVLRNGSVPLPTLRRLVLGGA